MRNDTDGETVYATEPIEERPDSTTADDDTPNHQDPEWLYTQYWALGRSQPEMADVVGVGQTTIGRWMRRHDIETRSHGKANSMAHGGHPKLWDEEWLLKQYVNQEKSTYLIAEQLDVASRTVYRALERWGIETRTISEATRLRHEREYGDRKYNDAEWLQHQYETLGKSTVKIAEEHGWASGTVRRALHRHGITSRSIKTAQLTRYKKDHCVRPTNAPETVTADEDGRPQIDATMKDITDVERGCWVPYRDREWMQSRVEEECSPREIADRITSMLPGDEGVTFATVGEWLQRLDIEREAAGDAEAD